MGRRFVLVVLVAGLGIFGSSRSALACTCVNIGPACQAYWKTDAVFDATVVSITPVARTETFAGREMNLVDRLVRLNVHRSWKGAQSGPLEVTTSGSGASCGFDFKEGQRYLVFAYQGRTDARLQVSICSGTQRFDGSGPAADFLASLEAPPRGGRVSGTVRTVQRVFDPERPSTQIGTETMVRLFGGGRERATRSTRGEYEFTGLPQGDYRVEIEVPAGYTTYSVSRDVQIPNGHACAEEEFWFAPAGRISGRLVGPDGRALPRVRIDVTS